MSFSKVEETIIDVLKEQYGPVWKKEMCEVVEDKRTTSKEMYDKTVLQFADNQSAQNYNLLIAAMLSLQYWNQKKIMNFSTEVDF